MNTQRSRNIDWDTKRENWIQLVKDLTKKIKKWAKSEEWVVSDQQKNISELHLGQYKIPTLLIQTPNGTIQIDPIGCNIVGAEGRVDILSFPSLNRIILIRIENKWQVKTDSRIDWPKPWGKKTFIDIVSKLTSI